MVRVCGCKASRRGLVCGTVALNVVFFCLAGLILRVTVNYCCCTQVIVRVVVLSSGCSTFSVLVLTLLRRNRIAV